MHFENQKVVDKDGAWFRNSGSFPFTDPTTGVRFDAGWAVKVKPTAWIKSQPVLVPVVDDEDEVVEVVAVPAVAAKPAKAAKPVEAPAAPAAPAPEAPAA